MSETRNTGVNCAQSRLQTASAARLRALVVAAASACISLPAPAPCRAQGAPVRPIIDVAKPEFDAGIVVEGSVIRHTFTIRNKGRTRLYLHSVNPECSCTVAQFDEIIPAGGRGVVNMEVDTTGFSGPIRKSVMITTNDRANPKVRLSVVADVKSFYTLHPHKRFSFPNARRSHGDVQRLTLSSPDRALFSIRSVTSDVPGLSLSWEPLPSSEAAGSRYELAVGVTKKTPVGMLKGEVVVETDRVELPRYRIPVGGTILGPVRFEPSSLSFIRVDPSDPATMRQTVSITVDEGLSLSIGSATSTSPLVEAVRLDGCDGASCNLEVIYKGGGAGIWKARITVATGVKEQPEITIPVIGKAVDADLAPSVPEAPAPKVPRGSIRP